MFRPTFQSQGPAHGPRTRVLYLLQNRSVSQPDRLEGCEVGYPVDVSTKVEAHARVVDAVVRGVSGEVYMLTKTLANTKRNDNK